MKLRYFGAASICIETPDGIKILCDPWFDTPAFIGSWLPFPKIEFDYKQKYEYIYISHIHSDHFDINTLSKLNKDSKILIYKFENPFLFKKIKSIGFNNIIQLNHGEKYHVGKDTYIKIYGPIENDSDAKQQVIDTSLLVKSKKHTILNFNDNIYELKDKTLLQIKQEYPKIDLLCHGYTSASSYPQCTLSLDKQEMQNEKDRVKEHCYRRSIKLIEFLNPKSFMPFAGYYVLCGKNSNLNNLKATDHPYDALNYYQKTAKHLLEEKQCVVLNVNEYYDLCNMKCSKEYKHHTEEELNNFVKDNKSILYPYEHDSTIPDIDEYINLIDKAYSRMEKVRKVMNYSTNTKIFINLPENKTLILRMNGQGVHIVDNVFLKNQDDYILMDLDFRLLFMLLRGPRYAHWDNADHGSHIKYYKKPNKYEKGLYHLICYFHA